MNSFLRVTYRKRAALLQVVGRILALFVLCLLADAVNSPANAQTSDVASSASTEAVTTSLPGDWTQLLRDNMQRYDPYEATIGVNNVSRLGVKWTVVTDPLNQGGGSSPAVVNGVVYIGSQNGYVYALDAATGAKLWSFSNPAYIVSSPAVINGVVYIGAASGALYAIDARTGAKLWSFLSGSYVFGSPAVVNGVVYFGSIDGYVYALNAGTGAELWRYRSGDGVSAPPAVANGVLYISSNGGDMYALNAATGAELWTYYIGPSGPVAAAVTSAPAVANGVVYIASIFTGLVYALNANTGELLWNAPLGVDSSIAVANGIVYVAGGYSPVAGIFEGRLYALNAITGAELWNFTTSAPVESSPAVANGVVYIGSDNGDLYALNAATGSNLWNYATGGPVGDPVVANGMVYVGATEKSNNAAVLFAFALGGNGAGVADLSLRVQPSPTPVKQGELLTYTFPVWNLGAGVAVHEVLATHVPAGTTFDYIRVSGTPGLAACTHPAYGGTGSIVCHENGNMAPNTTWTVRLTVKVTGAPGTVITESATATEDTPDPNPANNTATVSNTVQ